MKVPLDIARCVPGRMAAPSPFGSSKAGSPVTSHLCPSPITSSSAKQSLGAWWWSDTVTGSVVFHCLLGFPSPECSWTGTRICSSLQHLWSCTQVTSVDLFHGSGLSRARRWSGAGTGRHSSASTFSPLPGSRAHPFCPPCRMRLCRPALSPCGNYAGGMWPLISISCPNQGAQVAHVPSAPLLTPLRLRKMECWVQVPLCARVQVQRGSRVL